MTWAIYLPYRVGQLHFIVVAIMAISGYFAGYASIHWHLPFILLLVLGTGIGALISWVVSLAIGDAPCFAVVIVGFTFIYITKTVIENTKAIGSTMGMFGLPIVKGILPIAYLCVLIVGFLIYRFDNSRLGRAASAIFIDKSLATSFGVNVKKLGIGLQTFSGAIGGMCGVLYGFIMGSLFPDFFTFHIIGTCMTMLFLGGYTTIWGPLIAAPILWGLPLLFPAEIQSYRIVIYGVLLIVILALKPEGAITKKTIRRITDFFRRKKTEAGAVG
jgi:branched-chain amino acid transport system permease protein